MWNWPLLVASTAFTRCALLVLALSTFVGARADLAAQQGTHSDPLLIAFPRRHAEIRATTAEADKRRGPDGSVWQRILRGWRSGAADAAEVGGH
jgi:hypothetical protein